MHYFPIIIFKKNLMRIFIFFFFEIVFRLNNISIKMKKKPFDSQTAKKIINEYAERINLLSRENKVLRKQLEDANISLKINKEILYSHIKSKKNVSEECDSIISDLKKENERLNNKIIWLFNEKADLAKKLYKLEDNLNDKIKQESINNEKEKNDKFLFENKLKEKDAQIINLKKQIENLTKHIKNNCQSNSALREIYIGNPNTFNTVINNELQMSREIIKKYIYKMQDDREKERKLKNQIKYLQDKMSSQKANNSFIMPTPKISNKSNNPQLTLLSEILTHFKKEEEQKELNINNNLSLSSDSDEDKGNIDLSFIENKNIAESKENKRTKTCEKINKIPKLNFKKVEENYQEPVNIKVIGNNEINEDNNLNNNYGENSILEQRYKSQINIYKKTIENYKEQMKKLRNRIRDLIDNNRLLTNTIEIFINNNSNNNTKNKKDDKENDISMTPCVNDASGLSSNSIIFRGGTLENINKLSELNKKTRLNQIMTLQNNNNENMKNNNANNNIIIAQKEDPLDNIIINEDFYNKKLQKDTDKITTKGSSNN